MLIDGHSYVDVDAFVRIMNAAVSFEPGRVILTIPAAELGAKPERAAVLGLSKEFARASISQLAMMWEWKGAIASAIRSGVAGGNWLGPWLHDYRVRHHDQVGFFHLSRLHNCLGRVAFSQHASDGKEPAG